MTRHITTDIQTVIRVDIKLVTVVKLKERRHVHPKRVVMDLNQTQGAVNKDQDTLQNIICDILIDMGSVHARSARDNHILAQVVRGQGQSQGKNMFRNQRGKEPILVNILIVVLMKMTR